MATLFLLSDWGPNCNGSRYLMQITDAETRDNDFAIYNMLDIIGDPSKCEFKIADEEEDGLTEWVFGEKDSISYFFTNEAKGIPLFKFNSNGNLNEIKKTRFKKVKK